MVELLYSFVPIVDDRTRVLVLGTMPSAISLRKKEYYANPNNIIWTIIYEIFGGTQELGPSTKYEEKISYLKQKGIGLWDVLKECERKGSGDSEIKNGALNDFKGLISKYPDIRTICFNGQKARKLFFSFYDQGSFIGMKFINMPSTSPANASIPFEMKVEMWRNIRKEIEDTFS
jgi:methylated-DNA-[protein]-cysteine S-methyltransferase